MVGLMTLPQSSTMTQRWLADRFDEVVHRERW
jgi:hypothetical protein